MDPAKRSDISIGMDVFIVLKADQRTGRLTGGKVERILTNSAYHSRGIKVMLTDGKVGRVASFKKQADMPEQEQGNLSDKNLGVGIHEVGDDANG